MLNKKNIENDLVLLVVITLFILFVSLLWWAKQNYPDLTAITVLIFIVFILLTGLCILIEKRYFVKENK